MWRRSVPRARLRSRCTGLRDRRLGGAARARAKAPDRGRPAPWRHAGPALRGRLLRPGHRLQLVLLRAGHGRRPARGRPRCPARSAGRDPGLRGARALRPGSGQGGHPPVHARPSARSALRPGAVAARRPGAAGRSGRTETARDVRLRLRGRVSRRGDGGAPAGRTRGDRQARGPGARSGRPDEIIEALAPLRDSQGSYRLHNEFHYLVATAA